MVKQERGEGWEGVPVGVLVVRAIVGIRVDAVLAEVFPHGWALLGSGWVGRGVSSELWPAAILRSKAPYASGSGRTELWRFGSVQFSSVRS
jgi:hypothetical protein